MMKGSISHEDIKILNISKPNNRELKYESQKNLIELKSKINNPLLYLVQYPLC